MRNILLMLLLSVFGRAALAQGAPPQGGANQPYTLEYYYKVQWGRQQEFLQLFLKNHYPLLRKNVESGRMISVKIETHQGQEGLSSHVLDLSALKRGGSAGIGDAHRQSLLEASAVDGDGLIDVRLNLRR